MTQHSNVQEITLPIPQMSDLCFAREVAIDASYVGKTRRDDSWDCFEWDCVLHFQGRSYPTKFYCGLGHCTRPKHGERGFNPRVPDHEQVETPTPPSAADVLASLCSDATSADRTTFEDWCGDLGYDTDSRKAEKIYMACVETNAKLRAFLGEHFDEFAQAEH